MHRSKPFSGKAKRAQLQAKRALKREARADSGPDADAAAAAARARLDAVRRMGPEDAWLAELGALRLALAQAGGYEPRR